MNKHLSLAVGLGVALLAWLYSGYFNSYLDEEVQTHFFLKKHPTFQVKFYDMYATEADDKPLDLLKPDEREEYFEYCHARFGIESDSNVDLDKCKKITPPYLQR
ncbi:hypothetical protein [Chromobacterium amazonense]|uniref:Entry exclusion protein n=1 Tax=Chromobacterium amazonense TaxID=1382803 RepID=A0ABU8V2J7_9NEIS|nr:hypothetical protein [Chromobacterium amazonense]MDQ4541131.1 hypothetical protein [Chromobacterium amazonense]